MACAQPGQHDTENSGTVSWLISRHNNGQLHQQQRRIVAMWLCPDHRDRQGGHRLAVGLTTPGASHHPPGHRWFHSMSSFASDVVDNLRFSTTTVLKGFTSDPVIVRDDDLQVRGVLKIYPRPFVCIVLRPRHLTHLALPLYAMLLGPQLPLLAPHISAVVLPSKESGPASSDCQSGPALSDCQSRSLSPVSDVILPPTDNCPASVCTAVKQSSVSAVVLPAKRSDSALSTCRPVVSASVTAVVLSHTDSDPASSAPRPHSPPPSSAVNILGKTSSLDLSVRTAVTPSVILGNVLLSKDSHSNSVLSASRSHSPSSTSPCAGPLSLNDSRPTFSDCRPVTSPTSAFILPSDNTIALSACRSCSAFAVSPLVLAQSGNMNLAAALDTSSTTDTPMSTVVSESEASRSLHAYSPAVAISPTRAVTLNPPLDSSLPPSDFRSATTTPISVVLSYPKDNSASSIQSVLTKTPISVAASHDCGYSHPSISADSPPGTPPISALMFSDPRDSGPVPTPPPTTATSDLPISGVLQTTGDNVPFLPCVPPATTPLHCSICIKSNTRDTIPMRQLRSAPAKHSFAASPIPVFLSHSKDGHISLSDSITPSIVNMQTACVSGSNLLNRVSSSSGSNTLPGASFKKTSSCAADSDPQINVAISCDSNSSVTTTNLPMSTDNASLSEESTTASSCPNESHPTISIIPSALHHNKKWPPFSGQPAHRTRRVTWSKYQDTHSRSVLSGPESFFNVRAATPHTCSTHQSSTGYYNGICSWYPCPCVRMHSFRNSYFPTDGFLY